MKSTLQRRFALVRTTPRRRGYVLVVTLGLLVLSATLLVSIGRAAVDHALLARRQQSELQQRWAVLSARSAILAGADNTLLRLEQDLRHPLPVYRTAIELGGQQFDLILSDEQAKTNVNALIASAGKGTAETRVRNALSGTGLTSAILFHPASIHPDASQSLPSWIDGFGQIFSDVDPERLLEGTGTPPIETLTCWGGGAINLMRASRASLALSAGSLMNELTIGRLIKARDAAFSPLDAARSSITPHPNDQTHNSPSADAVTGLLNRARVDPKVRGQLPFTSRSTCHSLWVIPRQPGRTRYFLFVSDQSDQSDRQIRAFAW